MEKQELRQYHKTLRGQMSDGEAEEKSKAVCKQLLESEWYEGVQTVFGYYPLGKEVDCLPFLKQALMDGKRVALPRTGWDCDREAGDMMKTAAFLETLPEASRENWKNAWMDFFEISSLEQVKEGDFHVMEPEGGRPLLNPGEMTRRTGREKNLESQEPLLVVILVPGVVFDKNGNRYGYGKGYYDRYFSRFPKIHRIALAYENQLEDALETLQTDVKMDCIYTENAEYSFIRKSNVGESNRIWHRDEQRKKKQELAQVE